METAPKKFGFVLMPFADEFSDVYKIGIKEACETAGAYCERVDEQIFGESILSRIYNQISKADFIIADMTGKNPNVFYEVGYAHALGKHTILITRFSDDIPFDFKHFPHVIYGGKLAALREEVTKRVTWFLTNHKLGQNVQTIDFEAYYSGKNLSAENVVCEAYSNTTPHPKFVVKNQSSLTFPPGSFKIGIISRDYIRCYGNNNGFSTVPLPSGEFLHMHPDLDTLFPEAYAKVSFQLGHDKDKTPENANLTLRIFTENGVRDYPFSIHLNPFPFQK